MYVYIAPGQGQTTPWVQIVSLTHLFSQLLQFFPINDCNSFPHSNEKVTQFDLAVK